MGPKVVERSDIGPKEGVWPSRRAKEMGLDMKWESQGHRDIWMKGSTRDIFNNKVDRSAIQRMNVMYNSKTMIEGSGPRVKETKSGAQQQRKADNQGWP